MAGDSETPDTRPRNAEGRPKAAPNPAVKPIFLANRSSLTVALFASPDLPRHRLA